MIFKTKAKKENMNMVNWFEIPVANMERAVIFYEFVFNIKMMRHFIGGQEMAFFPSQDGKKGIGGALIRKENHKPSEDGPMIYFSTYSPDMEGEIFRVETARGSIINHKTLISEGMGYVACVTDTEGNRIALHSMH